MEKMWVDSTTLLFGRHVGRFVFFVLRPPIRGFWFSLNLTCGIKVLALLVAPESGQIKCIRGVNEARHLRVDRVVDGGMKEMECAYMHRSQREVYYMLSEVEEWFEFCCVG